MNDNLGYALAIGAFEGVRDILLLDAKLKLQKKHQVDIMREKRKFEAIPGDTIEQLSGIDLGMTKNDLLFPETFPLVVDRIKAEREKIEREKQVPVFREEEALRRGQVPPGSKIIDFSDKSVKDDELLSVIETEKLKVPYGTTRKEAFGKMAGKEKDLSDKQIAALQTLKSLNQDLEESINLVVEGRVKPAFMKPELADVPILSNLARGLTASPDERRFFALMRRLTADFLKEMTGAQRGMKEVSFLVPAIPQANMKIEQYVPLALKARNDMLKNYQNAINIMKSSGRDVSNFEGLFDEPLSNQDVDAFSNTILQQIRGMR